MKRSELKQLVGEAIRRTEDLIKNIEGSENPQTVAVRIRLNGKLEAYQAIQKALDNNLVELKLDADERRSGQ